MKNSLHSVISLCSLHSVIDDLFENVLGWSAQQMRVCEEGWHKAREDGIMAPKGLAVEVRLMPCKTECSPAWLFSDVYYGVKLNGLMFSSLTLDNLLPPPLFFNKLWENRRFTILTILNARFSAVKYILVVARTSPPSVSRTLCIFSKWNRLH